MDRASVKGGDRAASSAREYRNHPDNSLREPVRDWRDVPSLEDVVLKHFGLADE